MKKRLVLCDVCGCKMGEDVWNGTSWDYEGIPDGAIGRCQRCVEFENEREDD